MKKYKSLIKEIYFNNDINFTDEEHKNCMIMYKYEKNKIFPLQKKYIRPLRTQYKNGEITKEEYKLKRKNFYKTQIEPLYNKKLEELGITMDTYRVWLEYNI